MVVPFLVDLDRSTARIRARIRGGSMRPMACRAKETNPLRVSWYIGTASDYELIGL